MLKRRAPAANLTKDKNYLIDVHNMLEQYLWHLEHENWLFVIFFRNITMVMLFNLVKCTFSPQNMTHHRGFFMVQWHDFHKIHQQQIIFESSP